MILRGLTPLPGEKAYRSRITGTPAGSGQFTSFNAVPAILRHLGAEPFLEGVEFGYQFPRQAFSKAGVELADIVQFGAPVFHVH